MLVTCAVSAFMQVRFIENVSHRAVQEQNLGGGNTITNTSSFATSSAVTVTTSATIIAATSTSRVYMRLTNNSGVTVSCSLKFGTAPTNGTGLLLYASSSYAFEVDQNPYTGPVTCIAPSSASVAVIER